MHVAVIFCKIQGKIRKEEPVDWEDKINLALILTSCLMLMLNRPGREKSWKPRFTLAIYSVLDSENEVLVYA